MNPEGYPSTPAARLAPRKDPAPPEGRHLEPHAPTAPQPLTGIKVIDFTQVMLGPICTQMLADYGADVIKIERPPFGDLSRGSLEGDPAGRNQPIYRSINRNKRSIVLDTRSDAGKQVIYDLVKTADVVVNNFRAGVMERMGFGHEQLKKINPRIISAFGSGYGMKGPLAYKGGQDALAQAMSGVMMRVPNEDSPIELYATCICDYTAGMHLVQAILMALLHRERTGEGQQVAVSLFESMLAVQTQEAAMWMQRGHKLNWAARPLTGTFLTTDGAVIIVGAFKEHPLRDLCKALDLPDLSLEARFANLAKMTENKKELQGIFRARFRTNSTEYWLRRLDEVDYLCSPVISFEEALAHPQTAANGSIIDIGDGTPERFLGPPLTMSEGAFQLRHLPPDLGADTDAVLGEIGYADDRLSQLKAAKVLP